ncbi:uncharacterized protein LOC143363937 [Halictus rubicundus]|uniref:uncharacterized protein LOC143363937 n=1 Tax=Halictus rubicundus TaxID=77578 RepID=UPI004036C7C3
MQDRYTKWVELRPLRRATSGAIIQAVRELIVLRHGCPAVFVTDNGRQFVGKEMEQALREWGITHRRTPPYAPQCNPVERVNRVIKTMIGQYSGQQQRTWDRYCPEIAFAYNTAQHSVTGYSPAYLNSGREFIPPGTFRHQTGTRTSSPLQNRIQRLQEARELVTCNLARNFQQQQRHFDRHRRAWVPTIGSLVLRRNHVLSNKAAFRNAKLSARTQTERNKTELPSSTSSRRLTPVTASSTPTRR